MRVSTATSDSIETARGGLGGDIPITVTRVISLSLIIFVVLYELTN
jgi:hypothetical protein